MCVCVCVYSLYLSLPVFLFSLAVLITWRWPHLPWQTLAELNKYFSAGDNAVHVVTLEFGNYQVRARRGGEHAARAAIVDAQLILALPRVRC